MRRTVIVFVFIAISLGACNHEAAESNPLNALKSAQPLAMSNYGPGFWHDQYRRNTNLWRKAHKYCDQPDNRHTENCEVLSTLTEQPQAGIGTPVPYPKSWSAPDAPHAGLSGLPPNGWPPPTP
jgi:hypothetical protein